jgi:hypothetical protein
MTEPDDPAGEGPGDLEPAASDGYPLVDLADEYELTTVRAVELCAQLGIRAVNGASTLTPDEMVRFRQAVETMPAEPDDEDAATRRDQPRPEAAAWKSRSGDINRWQELEPEDPNAKPRPPARNRSALWAFIWSVVLLVPTLFGFIAVLVLWLVPVGIALNGFRVQRADPTLRGRGFAWAALVVTVFGIALLFAIFVPLQQGTMHRSPGQAALDQLQGKEVEWWTSLEVGQCFTASQSDLDDVASLGLVTVVECDEPHDVEVFGAIGEVPVAAAEPEVYPGQQQLYTFMLAACDPLFTEYAGAPIAESGFEVLPMFPPEDDWEGAETVLLCGARLQSGQQAGVSVIPG